MCGVGVGICIVCHCVCVVLGLGHAKVGYCVFGTHKSGHLCMCGDGFGICIACHCECVVLGLGHAKWAFVYLGHTKVDICVFVVMGLLRVSLSGSGLRTMDCDQIFGRKFRSQVWMQHCLTNFPSPPSDLDIL